MRSTLTVGIVGLLISCVLAKDLSQNMSVLLLMPKVLYEGDANFFVLEVQNQPVDGIASITIVNEDTENIFYYQKTFPVKMSQGTTFNLDVSDIKVKKYIQRNIYCTVTFNGMFGSTVIKEKSSIKIVKDNPLILVQTDKKIYKPGQKVFIRIMPLDYNLRPKNSGKISVLVSDPLNNVIASWANVTFADMVMQFDFQLIDEPAMGTWYITIQYDESDGAEKSKNLPPVLQTVTFSVSEYSLPKFEVTITPPPYLLMDADNATWKICANYTFGKPVSGLLKVNTSLVRREWERSLSIPENYTEALINGCYNLTLETSLLNLTDPSFKYRKIRLIANVFEHGTGSQMNATNQVSRTSVPLNLNFRPDSSDKYFRPYMNTHGSLKVTNPDQTPAPNEQIELCLTAKSKSYTFYHQRTDVRLMCKNYTSDDQGLIRFTLPPHKPSVVSLEVEAVSTRFGTKYYPGEYSNKYNTLIQQPRASSFYRAFFSPSEQYVQFEPLSSNEKLPCDKPVKLSAFYTFKDTDQSLRFKYVVMARARNILSREVVVTSPTSVAPFSDESELLFQALPNTFSDMASVFDKKIGRLDIEIDPASSELPQLTVALFYINGTEVVADSINVPRKLCAANKVELMFSETVVQPGEPITMTLAASANSQCGYAIVDRSVKLLSGVDNNPFLRYRDDLPNREIGRWEYPLPFDNTRCQNDEGQSDYVDSESIFLPAGWTAIVYNLILRSRPCRATRDGSPDNTPEPIALKVGQAPNSLEEAAFVAPEASRIANDFGGVASSASHSVVEVRNYFPESWLFEIAAVDGTGKLFRSLSAPHQVTTWIADAACVHPTDGLGVSHSRQIKTYQAFFTEVKLPYSVKRGENLPIIISTFNYLPHCLPVLITIDPIAGLEPKSPSTKEVCVCPDASPFQYEFRVSVTKFTEIGEVNVTVTAVNSDNSTVCSDHPDAITRSSRDKITRQLKVIPEGFMVEELESHMLCPNTGLSTAAFNLKVPENAIDGSARSLFSVSGDIMGQAVANLENLITLPTGCGEQNMAKTLSNLAVLEYLRATDQLNLKLKSRIISNLKSGYQNQLTFRGRDGSYSVWGGRWGKASSFLTAMVYQGFRQAKKYIFIDDDGQTNTHKYLLDSQDRRTGCFNRVGDIYSQALRRSETSNDTRGSYTAYVLVALHGALSDEARIETGLLCVRAQKNLNQHALALSAYAAALYNDKTLAANYLDSLKAFENNKLPNVKFYYATDSWEPQSIETSAYTVLAKLTLDSSDRSLEEVQPIVRWLLKKQNRNGGFSSSQDTVIGLRALAKFAEFTFKHQAKINNKLTVIGQKFDHNYEITMQNAIIWDTRTVNTIPNDLTVSSSGSGCVVATSQLRYNLPAIAGETGFDFNVTVSKASTVKNVILDLCVSYNMAGGQPSGMAIIELSPLSGYSVVKSSLNALKTRREINRYEATGVPIVLYFDEFSSTPRCVSVEQEQLFVVTDLQPANAVVYDYYDNGIKKSVEYNRGYLPSEQDNF